MRKFKKWFAELSVFQVSFFYLFFVFSLALIIIHNPFSGYERGYVLHEVSDKSLIPEDRIGWWEHIELHYNPGLISTTSYIYSTYNPIWKINTHKSHPLISNYTSYFERPHKIGLSLIVGLLFTTTMIWLGGIRKSSSI